MSAGFSPRLRAWAQRLFWTIVFIAMLIMQWPAATVAGKVAEACEGRCALGNVAGTLWSGRAGLYTRTPEGHHQHLLTLGWSVELGALTHGRLMWRLQLANGKSGTISVGLTGWQLAVDAINLPAASLAPLLDGRFALRGWGGQLVLNLPSLRCTWQTQNCSGDGTAQWLSARISSLSELRLGNYRLSFQRQLDDSGWTYRLSSDAGPLWLELQGVLDDRQLSLVGPAWLDPPARQAISPFLAAIGPLDSATGRYQLNFTLPLSRH